MPRQLEVEPDTAGTGTGHLEEKLKMKNEFTIFFAIPFDSLIRATYEKVTERLRTYYEGKNYGLETIIGSEHVGQSQPYFDVLSFKAQNEDLHKRFTKDIQRSHVIIADLTNGNPNVHTELGLALAMNKNILRVTGRSLGEIGFDIRNMEVAFYQNEDELFKKIIAYLDVFFTIKKLPFEATYKELFKFIATFKLPGTEKEIVLGQIWSTVDPLYLFRDGGIRFRAKFLSTVNDQSWLGISFRMSLNSGYLLIFRKNGKVELNAFPGPQLLESSEYLASEIAKEVEKEFDVLINIQNDEVEVKLNNISLSFTSRLELQNIGGVHLASFEAHAAYKSIEIINRDTI